MLGRRANELAEVTLPLGYVFKTHTCEERSVSGNGQENKLFRLGGHHNGKEAVVRNAQVQGPGQCIAARAIFNSGVD